MVSNNVVHSQKIERIIDQLNVILKQESTTHYGKRLNLFLAPVEDANTTKNNQRNECWRRKICEWLFQVVDHCEFDRQVVFIALNYLDRTASAAIKTEGHSIDEKKFQLLATTCFYIAMKLHSTKDNSDLQDLTADDMPQCKLRITEFVQLSRGLFAVAALEEKEREILDMLDWHVNPPTAVLVITLLINFLPQNILPSKELLNAKVEIYEVSRYLSELGVCVSSIAFNYTPSEIAYAAILCAFEACVTKIHIPLDMRLQFTNNISASITCCHLTPDSVSSLKDLLKGLSPSMFVYEDDGLCEARFINNKSPEEGKGSPVCVTKHPNC
mmetsp:Transcript_10324/g.15178  ORF Transcript_10324/g.15178 Transcript_10324/m.15178 type:complete len:328 (+) Transcript_10324:177-1160(+)